MSWVCFTLFFGFGEDVMYVLYLRTLQKCAGSDAFLIVYFE